MNFNTYSLAQVVRQLLNSVDAIQSAKDWAVRANDETLFSKLHKHEGDLQKLVESIMVKHETNNEVQ